MFNCEKQSDLQLRGAPSTVIIYKFRMVLSGIIETTLPAKYITRHHEWVIIHKTNSPQSK